MLEMDSLAHHLYHGKIEYFWNKVFLNLTSFIISNSFKSPLVCIQMIRRNISACAHRTSIPFEKEEHLFYRSFPLQFLSVKLGRATGGYGMREVMKFYVQTMSKALRQSDLQRHNGSFCGPCRLPICVFYFCDFGLSSIHRHKNLLCRQTQPQSFEQNT